MSNSITCTWCHKPIRSWEPYVENIKEQQVLHISSPSCADQYYADKDLKALLESDLDYD